MRFLIDENLGAGLVSHLRSLGHDARSVAEVARGSSDDAVLALALSDDRILITEDKDFGNLVYARRLPHRGILLLRLRRSLPADVAAAVERAILVGGESLAGRFAVVREGLLRLR